MIQLCHQTDKDFPVAFNRWACRFFSLIGIAQVQAGKALTPAQILEIDYVKAGPGIISPDMVTGSGEDELINEAFLLLGYPAWKGMQVGRMKGDTPVFWNGAVEWQYMICHWDTGGPDGHWTLFDAAGNEIYDPWGGAPLNKKVVDKRLLYRVWQS
jgi:hypothetical protein